MSVQHQIVNPQPRIQPPVQCPICSKPFSKTALRGHLDMKGSPISTTTITHRAHNCRYCNKVFCTDSSLKAHQSAKHRPLGLEPATLSSAPAQPQQSSLLQQGHIASKPNVPLKPFECTTCHKRFHNEYALRQHAKSSMKFHSSAASKSPSTQPKQSEQRQDPPTNPGPKPQLKRFECTICRKRFSAQFALRQHTASSAKAHALIAQTSLPNAASDAASRSTRPSTILGSASRAYTIEGDKDSGDEPDDSDDDDDVNSEEYGWGTSAGYGYESDEDWTLCDKDCGWCGRCYGQYHGDI